MYGKKKEKKKYSVGTNPKSNNKVIERGQLDTHKTLIFLAWYRYFNKKWRG
jgi:hypothetical protein